MIEIILKLNTICKTNYESTRNFEKTLGRFFQEITRITIFHLLNLVCKISFAQDFSIRGAQIFETSQNQKLGYNKPTQHDCHSMH